MKAQEIAITKIKPNPKNPRVIKDTKFEKLVKSIKEFPKMLAIRPIVVNEEMVVLGGNMRLKACREAGLKKVWVIKADELTEEEQKEFIVKDNVGFGDWDFEGLMEDFNVESLEDWGMDLPEVKFEKQKAKEDNFKQPEKIITKIREGDIIEIGHHRLICGDCTDETIVERLLRSNKPEIIATEAPEDVEDLEEVLSKPEGTLIAYVWHRDVLAEWVQKCLENVDYTIKAQIVLIGGKSTGRNTYNKQHKVCWYATRHDKVSWLGGKKQSTVWEEEVEKYFKPLENHMGDVYNPFMGKGDLMVAAEQLDRVCYGIEADPENCQVIIERMRKFDEDLRVKVNGKVIMKGSKGVQ